MENMVWDKQKYAAVARRAAAEGIVLLRNENGALPLAEQEKIAIFGRSQFHYYKSGTGSGGGVNVDYAVGIYEALQNSGQYEINPSVRRTYEAWVQEHPFDAGRGWAAEPWSQEEMPLDPGLVQRAAKESTTAVMIIGRTAGEDKDNKNEPGSFLLTDTERDVLGKLCNAFPKTIVLLNVGNIIDMRWVEEYKPDVVAYVWQGGQEGGNGVLDVLSGAINPCGKLSDTIAFCMEDYPSAKHFGSAKENIHTEDIYVGYRYFETFAKENVLYPFGFGLSYTEFDVEAEKFDVTGNGGSVADAVVSVSVKVANKGNAAGKEVVQVYAKAPQGALGKAERVLCGFAKTRILAPGESERIQVNIPWYTVSSYDDDGVTGHRSCYVLEAGEYIFYVGSDVRSAVRSGAFTVDETAVLQTCREALAPVKSFSRMRPMQSEKQAGAYEVTYGQVPAQTILPKTKRDENLPETTAYTGDRGYKLVDVADGNVTMGAFLAQLTDEDFCAMMRGEGMSSPKVTPGIAGAFGGITERLLSFGIPVAGCADGPSGIRMDCGIHAFSLPNGTCLACSFDEELQEELFAWEGLELRKNKIDSLLGPGMNIHRNPLNGRNFEYFSEDPFLTGKMAAAQLRGMHRHDVTGTIKHFACNTQEYQRNHVDAVVSERAAREIYLKGFEIAVREGQARSVMSTYGPVNGIWTAGNYELLTQILRGEWGFTGIVMTDWWAMANDAAGEKATQQNVAAQVRAQNDLNMTTTNAGENSGNDNLADALLNGTLTRGELCRSAANICRFLIKTPAFWRITGRETQLDRALEAASSQEELAMQNMTQVRIQKDEASIDVAAVDLDKGKTSCFDVNIAVRGIYELHLTMRGTGGNPLAQLPLSIYKDQNVVQTITLKGTDTTWQTYVIPLGLALTYNFYVRFFVAQAGIEMKEASLHLVENCEERIKAYLAARDTAKE